HMHLPLDLSLLTTHRPRPRPPPFPYTTLFRSWCSPRSWEFSQADAKWAGGPYPPEDTRCGVRDRSPDDLRRGRQLDGDLAGKPRSEEHTSELQSLTHLVCRLLLEKKKTKHTLT